MSEAKHTLIAWCAGVFEGEGWVGVYRRSRKDSPNHRYKVIAGVTNSEIALLTPFVELWNGRLRHRKGTKLSKKTVYEWRLEDKSAEKFLIAVLPYLRGVKSNRARACLELRELAKTDTRHRIAGVFQPLTTEEISCREMLMAKARA
jgi:hypothetical protein